jgi:ATP-binding cassette, subfamily B, heavy metal transporter
VFVASAGKTTLGRLLFRFYDVLDGAVKVNGIDVRNVTQHSLRVSVGRWSRGTLTVLLTISSVPITRQDAIGVVPQAASMFNDTLRSNLLYGRRDATFEELHQAAKDAQLLPFIEQLNEGWETMVGDRGLKLSGGEKQRAAIARCLLKDRT